MKKNKLDNFLETYMKCGTKDIDNLKISDNCISEEILCAYIEDNITNSEKEAVLGHIQKCAYCFHAISDLVKITSRAPKYNLASCPECNSPIPETGNFCPYCGIDLTKKPDFINKKFVKEQINSIIDKLPSKIKTNKNIINKMKYNMGTQSNKLVTELDNIVDKKGKK